MMPDGADPPSASRWPEASPWLRVVGRPGELDLGLSSDELGVWSCRIPVTPSVRDLFLSVLSVEESDRARRFIPERERELYVTAHGLLRLLLGAAVGEAPGSLRFASGPWGKPYLVHPAARRSSAGLPAFNIAHSGERVLLAFCANGAVGVDVERHRKLSDALDIAERFFSPREASVVRALHGGERDDAFFRIWTRKEAVVKAAGLSVATHSREAEVLPGGPMLHEGTSALSGEGGTMGLWWVDLPSESGYAAALAAHRPMPRVVLRELDLLA